MIQKTLKLFYLTLMITASTLCFHVQQAKAMIIDFQTLNIGDGLAQVNAVSSPLGATFDAVFPATFQVIADPDDASNRVVRSQTLPDNADILVNFSTAMDFVRVTYPNNPDGIFNAVLVAYDHTGTAQNIQGSGGVVGSDNALEPTTLEVLGSGIRAIQIESASGFLYADNIEFGTNPPVVPEPSSMLLLGSSLAGLVFRRKFC